MKTMGARTYVVFGIVGALLTAVWMRPLHTARTVQFDPSLPYTEIDGYKYHMEVFGDPQSTPMIVVHGGPGLDYNYLLTLKPLSKDYRLVFYDQRGTGLSPRGEPYPTLERSVEDLHSIVNHFSNGAPVKLIGHSWGGALVVAYLSKYPTTVSQAVIVEPAFLDRAGAMAWAPRIRAFLPVWDIARLAVAYPFVLQEDGQEGVDYIATNLANRDLSGPPYLCPGQRLPPNLTRRMGYAAYNNLYGPIVDHPESFTTNLAEGIGDYHGDLMLIASQCSILGYEFQEKHNLPLLPTQTIEVKVENTGHHVLTLNPEWSLAVLGRFFRP